MSSEPLCLCSLGLSNGYNTQETSKVTLMLTPGFWWLKAPVVTKPSCLGGASRLVSPVSALKWASLLQGPTELMPSGKTFSPQLCPFAFASEGTFLPRAPLCRADFDSGAGLDIPSPSRVPFSLRGVCTCPPSYLSEA